MYPHFVATLSHRHSVQYIGWCIPMLWPASALDIQFDTVADISLFWGSVTALDIQLNTVADVSPLSQSSLRHPAQCSGWCIPISRASLSLRNPVQYRGWRVPILGQSQCKSSNSIQWLMYPHFVASLSHRHSVQYFCWCIPMLWPASALDIQFDTVADISPFWGSVTA